MTDISSLGRVMWQAWGPDTCDVAGLFDWHPDNPARSQCGPTAMVVNDLLGGELMLGEVHEHGKRTGYHYWNRLPDGTEVDLTSGQFRPTEAVSAGAVVIRPAGAPRRCRGQYELLRHRVLVLLGQTQPVRPASDIALLGQMPPIGPALDIALLSQTPSDGPALDTALLGQMSPDGPAASLATSASPAASFAASVPAAAPADVDIALVLLRNSAGSVLLQLRDTTALAEPGQWSLPGGHREPGETFEAAARRELLEETGIVADGIFEPFWQATRPDLTGSGGAVNFHAFTAHSDSIPQILGEGQAATFVAVNDLPSFDLSPTAAAALHAFLVPTSIPSPL